jgi:putative ABC transport system permease protein
MLLFYLKTTFRSIRRNPLFAGLNIAGLGIGLCVFLFAMEYYSFETGFNQFHPRLPQLYRVNIAGKDGQSAETFPALAPFLQKGIPR